MGGFDGDVAWGLDWEKIDLQNVLGVFGGLGRILRMEVYELEGYLDAGNQ